MMDPSMNDTEMVIERLWEKIRKEIAQVKPVLKSWKKPSLPLGRVKKIMKTEELALQELDKVDDDQQEEEQQQQQHRLTKKFMISEEAKITMTKASEIFIQEIALRAWNHTDRNRRKTIQRSDIFASVSENEMYDFLIDIIPRVVVTNTSNNHSNDNNNNNYPIPDSHTTVGTAANQMIQQPPVYYITNTTELGRDVDGITPTTDNFDDSRGNILTNTNNLAYASIGSESVQQQAHEQEHQPLLAFDTTPFYTIPQQQQQQLTSPTLGDDENGRQQTVQYQQQQEQQQQQQWNFDNSEL